MVCYLAYSPIFRKDGARTHNLSLLGKCFTQRQPGRMLFLKLLFLLLAASTGIEPVKYVGQSGGPYPLGYEAICLSVKNAQLFLLTKPRRTRLQATFVSLL